MTDDETWWDRFLDRHKRLDRIDTWMWTHRPPMLWRQHLTNKRVREFKAGTVFLEHGHTPAVVIYLDEYDGYDAVSMVDGSTLVGSIMNCGPEIIPWRDAVKLANKMRAEAEERTDD